MGAGIFTLPIQEKSPGLSLGANHAYFSHNSNRLGCAVSKCGVEKATGKKSEKGLIPSQTRRDARKSSKVDKEQKPGVYGHFAKPEPALPIIEAGARGYLSIIGGLCSLRSPEWPPVVK